MSIPGGTAQPGPYSCAYDPIWEGWQIKDAAGKSVCMLLAVDKTHDRSDPGVEIIRKTPRPAAAPTALLLTASPSLRDALQWCVEYDCECLADHPDLLASFRGLLAALSDDKAAPAGAA